MQASINCIIIVYTHRNAGTRDSILQSHDARPLLYDLLCLLSIVDYEFFEVFLDTESN